MTDASPETVPVKKVSFQLRELLVSAQLAAEDFSQAVKQIMEACVVHGDNGTVASVGTDDSAELPGHCRRRALHTGCAGRPPRCDPSCPTSWDYFFKCIFPSKLQGNCPLALKGGAGGQ